MRLRLREYLCFLCLSLAASLAHAQDELVLNTGVRQPYTTPDGRGFLDQLMAEVFRRIGIKARIQVYDASERALINANNGIEDGTALRIKGLEAQYPNFVRVTEKVIDNDFVAYSLTKSFATTDWNSLAPYQVTYILGWKIFEKNVPASVGVTSVRDADQLFSLLRLDRADVALYERWQGLWKAREEKMKVRVMEPPLASVEMFIYLHKKHAQLVPRVEQSLAGMKRDGSYQRIYNATLKPLVLAH